MSKVCAIAVSDLQLTEKPPISRSNEESWLLVQERYIKQLYAAHVEQGRVPVFIAGDIFDKWNSSLNLVNHVISWLQPFDGKIHAIPGNHDMPHHSYSQLGRSAYWTLVEAGVIQNLSPEDTHFIGSMSVEAYPFGHTPNGARNTSHDLVLNVAIIHDYIWVKEKGFPGADEEKRWGPWVKKLKGYDVAIFGDNHQGFVVHQAKMPTVANCGTFMRRHSNEREYQPSIIYVHENGICSINPLDTSGDLDFVNHEDAINTVTESLALDMDEFLDELKGLSAEKASFLDTLQKYIEREEFSSAVQAFVLKTIQAVKSSRASRGEE